MKKNYKSYAKVMLLLLAGLSFSKVKAQYTTAASYPFAASSSTYSYLVGGTPLGIASDDVTATGIPIGFSFPFAGGSYSTVSVCSNGWVSFANTSTSTTGNDYNISGIVPAVMPLWEDISGYYGSASYLTSGTAPNRVFTVEWKNWIWNYSTSNSPSISFQCKLYEDGRVEFLYKQESGSITTSSGGATIGIAKTSTDYSILTDASSNPTASTSTYTYNILSRPANGQSYVWGQPPCLYVPTGGSTSNVTSSKATISWNNVSAPQGYEYVVNQSSGNPSVSGTPTNSNSVNVSGLTPGTSYYAHVRGVCASNSKSAWLHIPFATSLCIAPNISLANITSNSALALWNNISYAQQYEYIVTQDPTPPTSSTGTTLTTSNSFQLSGLAPATTYYIHLRSRCGNNEISDWNTTQLNTMEECLAPELNVVTLSPTEMKATWQPVNTAVAYEYAVTSFETPPSLGTTIYVNDVDVQIPNDNKSYYLHVRTKCISIFNTSEWTTVMLREAPVTSVSNVNSNGVLINAYPNPVKDVLMIKLSGINSNTGTISITDIAGKQLYHTVVNNTEFEVNMSNMPAGVYFLRYNDVTHNEVIKIAKQ